MKNKKKSKGERLGWQRLQDIKPVKLTLELIKGELVELRELPPCSCGKCFPCLLDEQFKSKNR